jgi:hypothetical protein
MTITRKPRRNLPYSRILPKFRYQPRLECLEDRVVPSWFTFAGDPQHSGLSTVASQPVNAIHWQTTVDQNPSGGPVHYGSPVFTPTNTVIIPVKTGASNGFNVTARSGANGNLLWSIPTDYVMPPHGSWLPPYGPTLTSTNRLYFAGNGGTIYYVNNPDTPGATISGQLAFYGINNYLANQAAFNASVFIDTPLTADNNGNIYFGFMVTGANPLNLTGGGVARIDANGNATYVLASNMVPGGGVTRTALSASPALSLDGNTLYVALNNTGQVGGFLVALNSTTLATQHQVALMDPRFGHVNGARISDFSTATPFVGPDGTVFFSVLGNPFNGSRGFLLHFSADLATEYTSGAFGWDDTQSIIPAAAVPSYHGTSSYLIFSKYNNYAGIGGDGVNRIAVLDPYASQVNTRNDGDPNLLVMKEIITAIGPTPEAVGGFPNAVREWCINATAIDPFTKSALCNSEDGNFYRWDFTTNTFTEMVNITVGFGAPYTPTAIAPDGQVYVINGGTLFALGGLPNYTLTQTSSLNPAAVGQSVTFTATVASTNNGLTPMGSITFKDGNTTLGTVTLVNGQASLTTSFATSGSHFITAAYSGGGGYAPGSTTLVESVRTYTTSVALNPSNQLVVTDATLGGKNDNLTIQSDTTNNRFVLSDPLSSFAVLGTIAGAVVAPDTHSVTIPFASVSGTQILINTLDGNDKLTVDLSLGNFAKAITFNGGQQSSIPGDSLTVTGGGTFANVTHSFTNNNDGTVAVTGNSLISYFDLEPIVDNLVATTRNFTYNGGNETITLTDAGGGRSMIDSTLGESVNFRNANTSMAVDAGTGNDTVSLVSFAGVGLSLTGGAGTNTLQGPNQANTWNISANDGGTLNGVNFALFQNLLGNAGADQFLFGNGFSISGTIDGAGGNDTLNFSASTTARAFALTGMGTTDGFNGTVGGIGGGFSNINGVIGSSTATTDSLTGVNTNAAWVIGTASDSYTSGGQTLTFAGLESFTGGSGNDTFTVTPSATVTFSLDGSAPTTGPGDLLNLNLTAVANGRADLNGLGLAAFGGTGRQPVNARNIETVNISGADVELFVNLNAALVGGFNGVAGFDGVADTTIFRLDAAGQNLNVLFNSQAALAINANALRALSITGSQDADNVRLEEVNGRHITQGSQAALGNGNFGGIATGSHLNSAMQSFLVSSQRPTNVQVHFDGGPGVATDAMTIVNTSRRNARYFADTMDTIKSGDINVTDTYSGLILNSQQSALRVSFESLTPIAFDGVGGTLTTDTSGIVRSGDRMTIRDEIGGLGNGFTQIVSTNRYFETTNVRGFDALEVLGKGVQLQLASVDPQTSLLKVMLNGQSKPIATSNTTASRSIALALQPSVVTVFPSQVSSRPAPVTAPAEVYQRPTVNFSLSMATDTTVRRTPSASSTGDLLTGIPRANHFTVADYVL